MKRPGRGAETALGLLAARARLLDSAADSSARHEGTRLCQGFLEPQRHRGRTTKTQEIFGLRSSDNGSCSNLILSHTRQEIRDLMLAAGVSELETR